MLHIETAMLAAKPIVFTPDRSKSNISWCGKKVDPLATREEPRLIHGSCELDSYYVPQERGVLILLTNIVMDHKFTELKAFIAFNVTSAQ